MLHRQDCVLNLSLSRTPPAPAADALAPLPSGFRYTFAPLIRCLYRWLWPEPSWWNLPCGMARPVIAPEQSFPLPPEGGASVAEALRRFIVQGCPETLENLTGWTATLNPLSPEGLFWTTDADFLRKHSAKLQKISIN